jgi:recombination protein RecA
VEFDILYGQGISRAGDVLDLASEADVVEKSGAWFSFQGDRIGQGRENARGYLEQHPDVLDKIEALLLAKHNIQRRSFTATGEERTERPPTPAAKGSSASASSAPSPTKGPNSSGGPAARPVAKGPAN